MRIDIMTLFPDAIEAMMGQSIIGRARDRGYTLFLNKWCSPANSSLTSHNIQQT